MAYGHSAPLPRRQRQLSVPVSASSMTASAAATFSRSRRKMARTPLSIPIPPVPAGCSPQSFVTSKANCISGAQANALTTYAASSTLRSPYVIQAAVGADQQMGRYGTALINYIHSQGVHQLATQNIDYPTNGTLPGSVTAPVQYAILHARRIQPEPDHGQWPCANDEVAFAGRLLRHQLRARRQLRRRQLHHHALQHGAAADYGRTSFAVRNRMVLYGSVSMPHFIQFSPFLIGQSGNPYNITEGIDLNKDSILNDRPYLVPFGTANSKNHRLAAVHSSRNLPATPRLRDRRLSPSTTARDRRCLPSISA